jgi:exopolysaccharide biosynthesis polyprenyl glycosylphosphotransferase
MNTENLNVKDFPIEPFPLATPEDSRRMGQSFRYLFPILYLIADLAGIYVSFAFGFWFRFYSNIIEHYPIYYGLPSLTFYFHALLFVSPIWLFMFAIFGDYKRRSPSLFDRFFAVLKGVLSGALLILATTFFYRAGSFSRIVLGIACIFSVLMIWLFREAVYSVEKYYLKKGIISKRAIFVGDAERGIELYRKVSAEPAWGIAPLGFVCDHEIEHPRLGAICELDSIIKSTSADLVVFNLPHDSQDFITDFVMKSEILNLEYMIAPDIIGLMTFNAEAGQIEGIPVLRWGRTPIEEGYARASKRTFDAVFSGVGLLGLSPILLGIAAVVKLDSPGPALFKQRRIGQNGRAFTMYKFRSMRVDNANVNGTGWTVKDDPRRTKVGAFIRKYNLDELPQLFNVFLGQMSLVGPRPEQPGYVEKFRDDIPRYFQRHKVKSGVTGWAQVNGLRGDTSITERTKYDLYYVENWSLIFDIKIIVQTLKNMFKSPGAY